MSKFKPFQNNGATAFRAFSSGLLRTQSPDLFQNILPIFALFKNVFALKNRTHALALWKGVSVFFHIRTEHEPEKSRRPLTLWAGWIKIKITVSFFPNIDINSMSFWLAETAYTVLGYAFNIG